MFCRRYSEDEYNNRRPVKRERKYSPDRDEPDQQSDTEEWGERVDDKDEEEERSFRKRRTNGDRSKTEREEPEPTEPPVKKPREDRKTIEDIFTKAGRAL